MQNGLKCLENCVNEEIPVNKYHEKIMHTCTVYVKIGEHDVHCILIHV